jgi:hypothetical protein
VKATTSVALEPDVLFDLMVYLRTQGDKQEPGEAVGVAVRYWLDAMRRAPQAKADGIVRGYQWKSLFLPEGTLLRMLYDGDHDYATVQGDHIVHHGRAVTPNQFANAFGSGVRNAWDYLVLRMPGEKHWKRACLRRAEQQRQQGQQALTAGGENAAPPEPPELPDLPFAPLPPHFAATPSTDRVSTAPPLPGWQLPERRRTRFRLEDTEY